MSMVLHYIKCLLIFLLASFTFSVSIAEPTCQESALEKNCSDITTVLAAEVCNVPDPKVKQNCIEIINSKKVPQDAFIWTMQVYKNNLGKLSMNKCVAKNIFPTRHYSVKGFNVDEVDKGIRNKCQVMINDTRDRYPEYPFRGHMYFIDLCTGKVVEDYFNMGTGTFKNKYANKPGRRSTLKGAFLTTNKEFSYQLCKKYQGGKCSAWRTNYLAFRDKIFKGEKITAPAVALIGIQKSNNRSAADFKYIHVSPYKSSWGCPSISAETEKEHRIIRKLAANGPSLVVNYGDNMEDPNKCEEAI